MKYYNVLLSLMILISNGFAQNEAENQNKTLDDVVIKETYETGSEEEKLPILLKSNFTNLVEVRERIHWSSVPWSSTEFNPAFHLFECRTSSPDLVEISPAPAKVFHANFEDLARWKLDILTSNGNIFFSLSGEGNPPKSIQWDGRGDAGDPLIPGEKYAYSFIATDHAGNKRTFPGEAFSVPALYLVTEEGVWVGLSHSVLFSPNGYGLLSAAEDYSTELADLVYYYANEGKIKIQSQHPDTDSFLKLLAKKLGRDITYFEHVADTKPQENCFLMWLN